MRRVFHCIEVIEIPEELIEPMHGRQKLIEIAQVIFTELTGCISLRFERCSNGASLRWYTHLGTGLADGGHTSADRKFAHDEVRSPCGATRLSVVIGEQHPFLGEFVEVWCAPCHHATMVSAYVPHPDIITHDEQDVGFL